MVAQALTLLFLTADPTPALKSLSGLNVPALKPWLVSQLPSLTQCGLPNAKEGGDDEVSVQAQFGKSPEVSVTRVEAALSDPACVRGVVEKWKRDSKQPSAGPFAFKYRFKPSAAQKDVVAAQARAAFQAMCPKLPQTLTREAIQKVMESTNPQLPIGVQVSLVDAMEETASLPPAKVSVALSRILRDLAETLKTDQCIRTAP
jgi:hypothetical protein